MLSADKKKEYVKDLTRRYFEAITNLEHAWTRYLSWSDEAGISIELPTAKRYYFQLLAILSNIYKMRDRLLDLEECKSPGLSRDKTHQWTMNDVYRLRDSAEEIALKYYQYDVITTRDHRIHTDDLIKIDGGFGTGLMGSKLIITNQYQYRNQQTRRDRHGRNETSRKSYNERRQENKQREIERKNRKSNESSNDQCSECKSKGKNHNHSLFHCRNLDDLTKIKIANKRKLCTRCMQSAHSFRRCRTKDDSRRV